MKLVRLVDTLRTKLKREICLIAESNVYDPELLTQLSEEGHGFDAACVMTFFILCFAVLRPGEHMSSREYHPNSDLDIVLSTWLCVPGYAKSDSETNSTRNLRRRPRDSVRSFLLFRIMISSATIRMARAYIN